MYKIFNQDLEFYSQRNIVLRFKYFYERNIYNVYVIQFRRRVSLYLHVGWGLNFLTVSRNTGLNQQEYRILVIYGLHVYFIKYSNKRFQILGYTLL